MRTTIPATSYTYAWQRRNFRAPSMYPEVTGARVCVCPNMYAQDSKEVDFQTGVYHPMIEYDTGELDTKKEFPRWRRDINHLYQLLAYARKVFHQIDTSNPVNMEAGKLYKTDINSYKEKVKESIENCRQATMNPDPSDPHSVRMGEWSIEVMKKARKEIFEPEYQQDEGMRKNAQTCGLSWVKPGTTTPFSKHDDS